MNRKVTYIYFAVATIALCICSTPARAQEKSPRDRLFAAHAQYYTPTASGLAAFQPTTIPR